MSSPLPPNSKLWSRIITLGEVSRESCSVSALGGTIDELHPFTKNSETGLG